MKKAKTKPTKPDKRKSGKFILLFGGVSAILAAFLLFSGIDMLDDGQEPDMALLTLGLSILFFLFSVMINFTGLSSRRWHTALRYAITVMAGGELILIPLVGSHLLTAEVICCILSICAAIFLFMTKKSPGKAEVRIPLELAAAATGTGTLLINALVYMILRDDQLNRIWAVILPGALYYVLAAAMVSRCSRPGQKNRRMRILSLCALLIQLAALFYTWFRLPHFRNMLIFQCCMLMAFAAIAIYYRIRSPKN